MYDNYLRIKRNLERIEEQIETACAKSGRSRDELKLLVVSKYRSTDEISAVIKCGYHELAENRPEVILERKEELKFSEENLKWHIIGTVQRRKVKSIISEVELIHSVDSLRLAEEIARQVKIKNISEEKKILLQVNCSREENKHGFEPERLYDEYHKIREIKGLKILGLMTMAENTDDERIIRSTFSECRDLFNRIKNELNGEEKASFKELSMGMSSDFIEAIEEGASIVRIGSLVFR